MVKIVTFWTYSKKFDIPDILHFGLSSMFFFHIIYL